jgi:hypothetical protein
MWIDLRKIRFPENGCSFSSKAAQRPLKELELDLISKVSLYPSPPGASEAGQQLFHPRQFLCIREDTKFEAIMSIIEIVMEQRS